MNNQPLTLDNFTVFKENPLLVKITMPDDFTIPASVTGELWVADVYSEPVSVTVVGKVISVLLPVTQIRPLKKARFYVVFNDYAGMSKYYILDGGIKTTMEGVSPDRNTEFVYSTLYGSIRVSIYSDAASAQLALTQASYLRSLSDAALSSKDVVFDPLTTTTTGLNQSGAGVNAGLSTISIPAASTGRNSYLNKVTSLDGYANISPGDIIYLRAVIQESVLSSIQPNTFVFTLHVAGVNVPIVPKMSQLSPGLVQYLFQFTIPNLASPISIRATIGPASTAPGVAVVYTWQSVGFLTDKTKFEQFSSITASNITKLDKAYLRLEAMSLVCSGIGNNTTDDKPYIQDDVDNAGAKGADLLLPRNKTYRLNSSVVISGPLNMVCKSKSSGFYGNFVGDMFQGNTPDRILFDSVKFTSQNVEGVRPFRFMTVHLNKDSLFQHCEFATFSGFWIESTEGLTLLRNRFATKFHANFPASIDIRSVNRTSIIKNYFGPSASAPYTANNIRVDLLAGSHRGLTLEGNDVDIIQTIGFYITTAAGVLLNDVKIIGNSLRDISGDTGHDSIAITAATANDISDVNILNNHLLHKRWGIWANGVKNLLIGGGSIMSDSRTAQLTAPVRALNILNSSYMLTPFIRGGQANTDSITGSTLLT